MNEVAGLPEFQQRAVSALLAREGLGAVEMVTPLCGDGSDRRFLRLRADGQSLIAVLPSPTHPGARAEAQAVWQIGRHLWSRQVPVPELFGYDPDTGIVLCEDLGDLQLHGLLLAGKPEPAQLAVRCRQAVELLLHMQLEGAIGFQTQWCWDTPYYDRALMVARESGYFGQALCRDFLGFAEMPPGLDDDFRHLAELAAAQPSGFFLHRDFQSRNLLCASGRLRVLDFQGGRFGPLAYDLASFLNDPYIDLPLTLRAELCEYYLQLLAARRPELAEGFLEGYLWLALQRNLQILGAFAFLTKAKGKEFFRSYLYPAAVNLRRLLAEPGGRSLPVLRDLATELLGQLQHLKIA
ncbi:MAG: phosphotransferase [Desulfobulbaceae bacterium]|nr:phosphotransferase [Desulfobulbaceae bacterium]